MAFYPGCGPHNVLIVREPHVSQGKQIVYRLGVQVPTDGAQIRDIPLPWENSQIDAARRAFLDRHPLAKNKEQVALAKGEGMLLR